MLYGPVLTFFFRLSTWPNRLRSGASAFKDLAWNAHLNVENHWCRRTVFVEATCKPSTALNKDRGRKVPLSRIPADSGGKGQTYECSSMTVFWHRPRHEDVNLHSKSDWDN